MDFLVLAVMVPVVVMTRFDAHLAMQLAERSRFSVLYAMWVIAVQNIPSKCYFIFQ